MTIKQYLIDMNRAVLLSVCCVCGRMTGAKHGHGVCGVSHGYCIPCINDIKSRKA